MFETIAFYLFSILTIGMFCITVFTNNVLYSLSSLASGMIFVSAFFFLLDADFLGVVQIIVYTGAVVTLYAFGMMFFDSIKKVQENLNNPRLAFFFTGMLSLLIVIIFIAPIIGQKEQLVMHPIHTQYENIQDIGLILFTKYLIPFEIAAVMLLVAMICGIILAGNKMDISYSKMSESEIKEYEKNLLENVEDK